jgi:predicted nucleic acid-binding protein
VIVDSDVIIEILRGNAKTASWLGSQRASGVALRYSPVCRAEIRAGSRPRDRSAISVLFATMAAVPIDAPTADIAGDQLARFSRSHGVQMGDALIAAAAIELGDELATFNARHFPGVRRIVKPDR